MIGIVALSASSGALGLPGSSSMKKLPSRKIRGRIEAEASTWIGRPASLTVKVTTELSPFRSSPVTSPTLTPAIRTGALSEMFAALAKVALSW